MRYSITLATLCVAVLVLVQTVHAQEEFDIAEVFNEALASVEADSIIKATKHEEKSSESSMDEKDDDDDDDDDSVEMDEEDFKGGHNVEKAVDRVGRTTLKNLSTPDVAIPTVLPDVKVVNATTLPISSRARLTYNPTPSGESKVPIPSARNRVTKKNDGQQLTVSASSSFVALGLSLLLFTLQ
ncbi:hypothetical protein DM01DRAFT_1191711 [Hesseltinella vesiculosa]|uniref:Uncharacterized protein n=1 Tax=Hesseltinella vesiculosa TaxID=101127 RepID=A0A1X2GRH9_9FUNG|nr:hypothetical protein DM01DRAFT_1191711 [Hesseltinella vesiculosa]